MISTQVTWRRENDHLFYGGPIRRMLDRRRLDRADEQRAFELVRRWNLAAGGVGLTRDTSSCAGIPGLSAPQVIHVVLGQGIDRLTVRMLPGQLMADYQDYAAELAEGLGAAAVRFRWRSHGLIIADLWRYDPLDSIVELPPLVQSRARDLLVGMLDTGQALKVQLASIAHLIVQGQTRSGKSRWTYGWLSQLATCEDVRISGSDVSGVLLRPFVGTRHGDHLALGTADLEEHARVLEELVTIMDERITRIPDHLDVLPASTEDPYEVVVLEELPGLVKAAQDQDAMHKGDRSYRPLLARIQGAYGRLLAEGAKVGFRLVILMQRADATIIGGFQRGQATLRLSFAVQDPESVKMLHSAASTEVAEAHTAAVPGRALVSGPGIPVARLRAPEMGDYATFRANVAGPELDVIEPQAVDLAA